MQQILTHQTTEQLKRAGIVYFSGTGSTARVAEHIKRAFEGRAWEASIYSIEQSANADFLNNLDCLIILFPVYVFNAPEPILSWIKHTPIPQSIMTAVLSVSGGGEVWPNNASRAHCIRMLKAKRINVVYEDMLVMPSNFGAAVRPEVSAMLHKTLPEKAERLALELIQGQGRCIKVPFSAKNGRMAAKAPKVL